jgi:hypothetical protein
MLYFDKEYLSQYLDTGLSLKVFVDGNMLSVPSKNDLGKNRGTGYQASGKPAPFDYKAVTKVKIGSNTYTLDMLNKSDAAIPDIGSVEGGDEEEVNNESVVYLKEQIYKLLEGKYSHINFTPPDSVAKAAERGLEMRKKSGGKGGLNAKQAKQAGVGSGVQRASNLKNKSKMSPETVKRMRNFFSRHNKNLKVDAGKSPSQDRGYIAGLLWGGSPGRSWANKIIRQMDAADKKSKQ